MSPQKSQMTKVHGEIQVFKDSIRQMIEDTKHDIPNKGPAYQKIRKWMYENYLYLVDGLLATPNRKEILNAIYESEKSITDISKSVGLSYKNTFFHIKELERVGLVRRDKDHKASGRRVIVRPNYPSLSEFYDEVLDALNF